HGRRLQLLDLPENRLSSPDCREIALPPALGRGSADHLSVQHRRGAAPLLQSLRNKVILCAAVASGRVQRQRALPRSGHRAAHAGERVRRSQLGIFGKGEKMGKVIVAALVLGLSTVGINAAWAQKKDCNELKTEIEAKIKKNGVDKFTLDIVDADKKDDGKGKAD